MGALASDPRLVLGLVALIFVAVAAIVLFLLIGALVGMGFVASAIIGFEKVALLFIGIILLMMGLFFQSKIAVYIGLAITVIGVIWMMGVI